MSDPSVAAGTVKSLAGPRPVAAQAGTATKRSSLKTRGYLEIGLRSESISSPPRSRRIAIGSECALGQVSGQRVAVVSAQTVELAKLLLSARWASGSCRRAFFTSPRIE